MCLPDLCWYTKHRDFYSSLREYIPLSRVAVLHRYQHSRTCILTSNWSFFFSLFSIFRLLFWIDNKQQGRDFLVPWCCKTSVNNGIRHPETFCVFWIIWANVIMCKSLTGYFRQIYLQHINDITKLLWNLGYYKIFYQKQE